MTRFTIDVLGGNMSGLYALTIITPNGKTGVIGLDLEELRDRITSNGGDADALLQEIA